MRNRLLLPYLGVVLGGACAGGPVRGGSVASAAVENGIDVLRASGFAELRGRRVGLITNHTGLDLRGESTALLLYRANDVDLRALFSPEHGLSGAADAQVPDTVHPATGLPIHSLYTESRAPNLRQLAGLDTLVFDIQDVGCRFYTYISTMGEAMKVAARARLRFVVLDRPNPIGGAVFGGPMRDADAGSFVAWHDIPVRHGMSVGELAVMFDRELGLHCDLHVVRMRNWQRGMFFDQTGQTWVNPSPNMRSPAQALLYPGVGLLETTNVSVGRGTDTPFEVLGAPWMDGGKLAATLNAAGIPGLRCVPIRFTPDASVHAGDACSGVRFWIIERWRFDPIRLFVELAAALRLLHPRAWSTKGLDRLLANREVSEMVATGKPAAAMMTAIDAQSRRFAMRRAACLLYEP